MRGTKHRHDMAVSNNYYTALPLLPLLDSLILDPLPASSRLVKSYQKNEFVVVFSSTLTRY